MTSTILHLSRVVENIMPFESLQYSKRSIGSTLYIFVAITAAGVMPCGGPKKSSRTSSIVQIIFLLRSFEISKYIQSVQNTYVYKHTSKQCLYSLTPFRNASLI